MAAPAGCEGNSAGTPGSTPEASTSPALRAAPNAGTRIDVAPNAGARIGAGAWARPGAGAGAGGACAGDVGCAWSSLSTRRAGTRKVRIRMLGFILQGGGGGGVKGLGFGACVVGPGPSWGRVRGARRVYVKASGQGGGVYACGGGGAQARHPPYSTLHTARWWGTHVWHAGGASRWGTHVWQADGARKQMGQ